MSLATLLTESMDVYSATFTPSASGGVERSDVSKASGVPCRIQDASAEQRQVNAALGIEITHVIFTKYADAVNGDMIVIGGPIGGGGNVFGVVGHRQRRRIGGMDDFYVYTTRELDD